MPRTLPLIAGLIFAGCSTVSSGGFQAVSRYAAEASWKWQGTESFLLRGRARLHGLNQVFSGPVFIRASVPLGILRADFCGPGGGPLLSVRADSNGTLIYLPEEGDAWYHAEGTPFGSGSLGVNALLSMVRTGYPAVPEHRVLTETCDTLATHPSWAFTNFMEDSMLVVLDGDIFPSVFTGETVVRVTASSWHDRFNAWPLEWHLISGDMDIRVRLNSIDVSPEQSSSVWELSVPVPIDTLRSSGGPWFEAVSPQIR